MIGAVSLYKMLVKLNQLKLSQEHSCNEVIIKITNKDLSFMLFMVLELHNINSFLHFLSPSIRKVINDDVVSLIYTDM
jgi:hypothetical protein